MTFCVPRRNQQDVLRLSENKTRRTSDPATQIGAAIFRRVHVAGILGYRRRPHPPTSPACCSHLHDHLRRPALLGLTFLEYEGLTACPITPINPEPLGGRPAVELSGASLLWICRREGLAASDAFCSTSTSLMRCGRCILGTKMLLKWIVRGAGVALALAPLVARSAEAAADALSKLSVFSLGTRLTR